MPHRTEFLSRLPLALPGAAVAALGLRTDELITRGSTEAAAVHEGRRLALAIAVLAVAAALLAAAGPALTARFGSIRPGARTALGLGLLTVLVVAVVALWAGGSPGRARDDPRNGPAQCDPCGAALPPVARGEGRSGKRPGTTSRTIQSSARAAARLDATGSSIGRSGDSRETRTASTWRPWQSSESSGLHSCSSPSQHLSSRPCTFERSRWCPRHWVPTPSTLFTLPSTGFGRCSSRRRRRSSAVPPPRRRTPGGLQRLPGAARVVGVGFALVLGAFSFVGLIGNSATAASERALARGDLERAEEQARRAAAWSPWAAEPWLLLSRTQTEEESHETHGRAWAGHSSSTLATGCSGTSGASSPQVTSAVAIARAARLDPRDMRRLTGKIDLAVNPRGVASVTMSRRFAAATLTVGLRVRSASSQRWATRSRRRPRVTTGGAPPGQGCSGPPGQQYRPPRRSAGPAVRGPHGGPPGQQYNPPGHQYGFPGPPGHQYGGPHGARRGSSTTLPASSTTRRTRRRSPVARRATSTAARLGSKEETKRLPIRAAGCPPVLAPPGDRG